MPITVVDRLIKETCVNCVKPVGSSSPIQCDIIQGLRTGTLVPRATLGHPCAEALYCNDCFNKPLADCAAEKALESATDPDQKPASFDTKIGRAVIISAILPGCPLDLYALTH